MTITLKLSAEQERRLREGTARHDREAVRQVLLKAVDPTVEVLMREPFAQPAPGLRRALLEELAEDLRDAPALPDDAVSRSGIYGDHP